MRTYQIKKQIHTLKCDHKFLYTDNYDAMLNYNFVTKLRVIKLYE